MSINTLKHDELFDWYSMSVNQKQDRVLALISSGERLTCGTSEYAFVYNAVKRFSSEKIRFIENLQKLLPFNSKCMSKKLRNEILSIDLKVKNTVKVKPIVKKVTKKKKFVVKKVNSENISAAKRLAYLCEGSMSKWLSGERF